jgi:hypothetical protein
VIWGSELGTGWSHSLEDVPFVFAGGANYGTTDTGSGPLPGVLVST